MKFPPNDYLTIYLFSFDIHHYYIIILNLPLLFQFFGLLYVTPIDWKNKIGKHNLTNADLFQNDLSKFLIFLLFKICLLNLNII